MNQDERLDYLINSLRKESDEYRNLTFAREKRQRVLRSLMNMRMPRAVAKEYLEVEAEYLKEEASKKGIVSLEDIPTIQEEYGSIHAFADRLSLWQGDITRLAVDAIVNAANAKLLGCFIPCHRCVDNAIHSAAGVMLREECNMIMKTWRLRYGEQYEAPTGCAELTGGYNLPAKFVIHTVGPIVSGNLEYSHRTDLQKCYRNVMECALENGIHSVAFCCISTGEFGFPNEEAAHIAVETVSEVLQKFGNYFERVVFNVFQDVDLKYYQKSLLQ